jgi:PPOX class probable F420-dependent enzyme
MTTTGTAGAGNRMSAEELRAFLAEPQEARLATVRDDGEVHLTPVWYLPREDGTVVVCLESRRLHLANLRARPSATLLVDEDTRPKRRQLGTARAAMLRGTAEIVDDQEVVEPLRAELRARYYGPLTKPAPPAEGYRYSAVILRPQAVVAWDFSKEEAVVAGHTEDSLRARVQHYFDAIDTFDVEAAVALFAPDGELRCESDGRHARGHDEIREFLHGVVDGSVEMIHDIEALAVDASAGTAFTLQAYRDQRSDGRFYDERTINSYAFDPDGRLRAVRFWRGKPAG